MLHIHIDTYEIWQGFVITVRWSKNWSGLVSDSLEVISKEYADFYDPKKFDDPQVFDDPKEISIGSMDFDNPKLYGDTSIFDGLVITACKHL